MPNKPLDEDKNADCGPNDPVRDVEEDTLKAVGGDRSVAGTDYGDYSPQHRSTVYIEAVRPALDGTASGPATGVQPADESVAGEEDPGAGLDGSEDAADAAAEIPKAGATPER